MTRRAAPDVGDLRERRQIADGCWTPDQAPEESVVDANEHDALADQVAEHQEQLLATIGCVLDALGAHGADREHHAQALRALIAGLLLELCLGHRDPAQARSVLSRHLLGLLPQPR